MLTAERPCPDTACRAVAPGWLLWLCLALPGAARALDCPRLPQQLDTQWELEVKAAVGQLSGARGAELQSRARSTTVDLLGKLPQADKVYLEQMLFASYCSALRDNAQISEAEREARIKAYTRELRQALHAAAAPPPALPDARAQARARLDALPLPYTADAFVAAAARGERTPVELFLRAGMDPDAKDRDGSVALVRAAVEGHAEVVQALLAGRAGFGRPGAPGNDALDAAAHGGHLAVLRLLLARKPAPELVQAALLAAAIGAQREALPLLLVQGASVRSLPADSLLQATKATGDAPRQLQALRLLLELGVAVDTVDSHGWTALHQVVHAGHVEAAALLLAAGAEVNRRCVCDGYLDGGYHAITMAGRRGDAAMLELLIKSGADLNLRSNDGGSALWLAARSSFNAGAVQRLLAAGADPNARDRAGNSVLMVAVDKAGMVDALLAAGASVQAANAQGDTALIRAAAYGKSDNIKSLLAAGAALDGANARGRTALMAAVRNGQHEAARELLQRGARTDLQDEDGQTAMAMAESQLKDEARTRMIGVLRKAGAT